MKTPSGLNARPLRFRTVVLIVAAVALFAAVIWPIASIRAAEPTTAPADLASDVSPRQRNLLLQLADSEANIQAINKALRRTGYKVGLAYDRIESNQKGNELMDRKGGGPVRWDDFYGRTARDFYAPESWGALHREGNGTTTSIKVAVNNKPLQRPAQFDFIYKANNDQIARANEKIASLQQDQTALLARRQFHESEQSRLWSTLVLTRVQDQEISLRPLYRFRLKPAGSDAAILRPIIRFLRIADVASADGLASLKTDQDATYSTIDHRMQEAYSTLQKALADALYAPDLKPGHREQGEELKALCKRLAEESSVIADNYHKAIDSDQAKEDSSKLQFRAELQSSLAFFAAGVGQLDQQITKTAGDWQLTGESGIANPDEDSLTHDTLALSPERNGPPDVDHKNATPKSPAIGGSHHVTIVSAQYGRGDQLLSVAEPIQKELNADPFSPVAVTAWWGRDPAPNVHKSLMLTYRVGDSTQSVEAQDGEVFLVPPIPQDGVTLSGASIPFKIVAARYGVDNIWLDVTKAVRAEVKDPSKPLKVHNLADGRDLHFGVNKHLLVYFEINGKRYARMAVDDQTINLTAD